MAAKSKKKTPAKKKSPSKKGKSKPIPVNAVPLSKTETAILELQEVGIKPFKDPMLLTSSELEQRTIALDRGKSQQEAELAACLYAIEEKQIPTTLGFDRKDYYRERLGISFTKATEQAKTWRLLIEVGLKNIQVLGGLSWTKLKVIRRGIVNRKITTQNLDLWLGRCIAAPTSPGYVMLETLENMVKRLIAEADKAAMSKETKTVKFDVMAYEMDLVIQFENIAKDALKTDNRGAWFLQALVDFSANYANLKNRKDATYWKSRGLANLKELVERTAPVAALFVPLVDDLPFKKLGIVPTSHIYQGYKDGGSDPLFCTAMSEKEAIEFLGVKHVRMFPILVANSLMPKAPFRVEPEKPVEPEKKAKKGKKAKPSSFAEGVKKMGKKEVNTEIAKLVKAMGIKEKAYMAQKDILGKALAEGMHINQSILCWLYEEDAKKGKKKKAPAAKSKKKKASSAKPSPKTKRQRTMKEVDPKPKKKPAKKKGKK